MVAAFAQGVGRAGCGGGLKVLIPRSPIGLRGKPVGRGTEAMGFAGETTGLAADGAFTCAVAGGAFAVDAPVRKLRKTWKKNDRKPNS